MTNKLILIIASAFMMIQFAIMMPLNSSPKEKPRATAKSPKIYAAVLSNKSYTVGLKNAGTGIYVGDLEGRKWQNLGFKNMRTFALEVFPDIGDGLIYAASGNGVMVSRDGGQSWRVATGWQITEVLRIKAVSQNPATVYIGTAYGAYKSEKYGEAWQRLTRRFVSALHLDIADPKRIYIGEEDGLRISKNSGEQFRRVKDFQKMVNSLAQDPGQPERLFLGTEENGLFLSTDRGKTWQPIATKFSQATVYHIFLDPQNPKRIFAATYAHGVLHSGDGGQSWQSLNQGLASIPVYDVAIHPDHPDILYAATINFGIYRSLNGGRSWQPFALNGTQVMEIEIK